MRLPVLAALLAVSQAAPAAAQAVAWQQPGPSPAAQCRAAIGMAERLSGIPDRLMQSIGIMESGRRDGTGILSAYPWTINAQGVGSYYATKAEAIAAVNALRARGVRSIDVGCMQVNLMYHASAFASLEEAFDPAANAAYAAKFLLRLLAQTGSWQAATAGYHSLTPEIGGDYGRKVMAIWARPAPAGTPAPPLQPQPQPQPQPASPIAASFAAQSAAAARIIPMPGAATLSTGRSLDSYRSAPTRLAFSIAAPRG